MTAEHPNAELYRRYSRAGRARDMEELERVLAPDVRLVVHGNNRMSGEYHGIEGVLAARALGEQVTGDTVRLEPEPILADDRSIMFIARLRAQRGDAVLDTHNVYLYRVADGRIHECHTIPVDQHVADAFWGPPDAAGRTP